MSALSDMVAKLDGLTNTHGYVTALPELRDILAELSNLVPVGIHLSEIQYSPETDVSVTITLGFTIERDHLK